MSALPKVLFRCSAATLQRCNLVLQRCNIVTSPMMPPISAHATGLCVNRVPLLMRLKEFFFFENLFLGFSLATKMTP